MLCIPPTMLSQDVCLSVRLSVTLRYAIKTSSNFSVTLSQQHAPATHAENRRIGTRLLYQYSWSAAYSVTTCAQWIHAQWYYVWGNAASFRHVSLVSVGSDVSLWLIILVKFNKKLSYRCAHKVYEYSKFQQLYDVYGRHVWAPDACINVIEVVLFSRGGDK